MAATHHKINDWRQLAPEGQPRGYINAHALDELWIHTGTACNLACSFCLEGSTPGDTRLPLVRFGDVQPYIDEAVSLGVKQLSFTGGEPFLARELPRILEYAAERAPCLVLTNATRPLQRRLQQLLPLLQAQHPVSFRGSIDHPDPDQHDSERGAGNFHLALQGLKKLHDLGFKVSVARQWSPGEDTNAINARFQQHFRDYRLPEDLHIIWFPDFHRPGEQVDTPAITEHCMTAYHTAATRADFMCAYSRMLIKTHQGMRVYACTLVDDDPEYDMGTSLQESLKNTVLLRHHRCYSCFKYGASCSEGH